MGEMLGYLGENESQFPELPALKLGKCLLKKAKLVCALQTHLKDWMGRTQSVPDYESAYTGLLPKCLLGLLDLFHDNARFYISRIWAVGPETIKPDWSLGVYAAGSEFSQPRAEPVEDERKQKEEEEERKAKELEDARGKFLEKQAKRKAEEDKRKAQEEERRIQEQ